jgi:hypothetical protein
MPNRGIQVPVPENFGVDVVSFQRRNKLSDSGMSALVDGVLSRGVWAQYKRNAGRSIGRVNLAAIRRMLGMTETQVREKLNGLPNREKFLRRNNIVRVKAGPAPAEPCIPYTVIGERNDRTKTVSRTASDLQAKLVNNYHQLGEKDQILLTKLSARLARSARILKSAQEMDGDI